MGSFERHRPQLLACDVRPNPWVRRARDAAGAPELESGRDRRRTHRRPGQGHRRQALCVRFSRGRPSRLALEYVACVAHPRDRRNACLHWHRSFPIERRAQTVARGHRRGSRSRRHPRARVLCAGRSFLPGREDAAVSRPAAGDADLRAVRRVRPGAPGIARSELCEVWQGNRSRRDRAVMVRIASCALPARRRMRRTCIRQCRPVGSVPRRFRKGGHSGLGAGQPAGTGRREGLVLRRADPCRARREQSGPVGAGSRIRDAIRRPDVPRAGSRHRLVRPTAARALELVVGTQSAMEAAESVAYLLGNARGSFKPAQIHMHCAYVGGGFGGRDHTIMPLYIALAAMFFPDRPVRLANNRYEQFQSGIKRHAYKMRTRIGVDRATGKIRAFAADHVPRRRRTCQFFRASGPMSAPRRRWVSMTSPTSTSPRWSSIRAASPQARCAATERCRR